MYTHKQSSNVSIFTVRINLFVFLSSHQVLSASFPLPSVRVCFARSGVFFGFALLAIHISRALCASNNHLNLGQIDIATLFRFISLTFFCTSVVVGQWEIWTNLLSGRNDSVFGHRLNKKKSPFAQRHSLSHVCACKIGQQNVCNRREHHTVRWTNISRAKRPKIFLTNDRWMHTRRSKCIGDRGNRIRSPSVCVFLFFGTLSVGIPINESPRAHCFVRHAFDLAWQNICLSTILKRLREHSGQRGERFLHTLSFGWLAIVTFVLLLYVIFSCCFFSFLSIHLLKSENK